MAIKDLVGMVFHRWTVLSLATGQRSGTFWNCRCECGTERVVNGQNMKSGLTKSCGCLKREVTVARTITHGLTGIPEQIVWQGMIQRCHNQKHEAYKNYGGRGILVCDHWRFSFANFIGDMGRRPSDKHTVERKNNDLGYCPENCEWVTRKVQSRNSRKNRILTFNGKSQCIADWADELGVKAMTLAMRLHRGWSDEKTLSTPISAAN